MRWQFAIWSAGERRVPDLHLLLAFAEGGSREFSERRNPITPA